LSINKGELIFSVDNSYSAQLYNRNPTTTNVAVKQIAQPNSILCNLLLLQADRVK